MTLHPSANEEGLTRPDEKTAMRSYHRKILRQTQSLCPRCLRIIPAQVVQEDKIFIEKECIEHGHFKSPHVWDNPGIYHLKEEMHRDRSRIANGLVLNITTSCNFSCPFCYAMANDIPNELMSRERISSYLRDFKGSIVYLAGGEPTLRPDLLEIIRDIKNAGFSAALFTNGKRLAEPGFVESLKGAGLDLVILQFDTFEAENYRYLRGDATLLPMKLSVVDGLGRAGIPTYLFVMVVKGRNDNEISHLLEFAVRTTPVKIINFQPIWDVGRTAEYNPLTPGDILGLVQKAASLSERDFAESTLFSYYLSEILASLKGKDYNTHPSCEMRCYVTFIADRIVPLGRLLPLSSFIRVLKWVCRGRSSPALAARLGAATPPLTFHLCSALLRRPSTLQWLARCGKALLSTGKGNPLLSLPLTSVVVGTFPNAENIDFEMTKSCNLYADIPEAFSDQNTGMASACMRQILVASKYRVAVDPRAELSPKFNSILRTGESYE